MNYAQTRAANLTLTHLTKNLFRASQMNYDTTPAALLPTHNDSLRYTAQKETLVSCSSVPFSIHHGLQW